MPLILQSRIYRSDLRANPDALYVFGDNEDRWGFGGQAAEMRGEHNAIGVATLKAPGAFWSDDASEHQCNVLDEDMAPVFRALREGRVVVFPLDGIGSGLADLERRSPTTWSYLQLRITQLKELGK